MVTNFSALPDYGFRRNSFVTPRGATMNFVDEGPRTAPAVLMLHGNPTWSFYYRRLVHALATTRRCIAPDHIGMGLSEKPQDYDYSLATRIADVEALVASLGVKQLDLVVHDWGGAIGFGFAAKHPALIRRIVILNTAAFTIDLIPGRIALCRAPLLGPLIVRGFNGFAGPAASMAMHRRKLTEAEQRGYLLPYDSWANRVAVSAFVQDIPMRPEHRSWAALKAAEQGIAQFQHHPVLIVWGGKDFCFDDRFLARWKNFLPQAAIHRIPDAGHYVLEDASEAVPLAAEFLSEPDQAGAL